MKLPPYKDQGAELALCREGILQRFCRLTPLRSDEQYRMENLLRKLNYDEGQEGMRIIGALSYWATEEIEQLKAAALVDEAEQMFPKEDEGKG